MSVFELTILAKTGGPLTKQISLNAEGFLKSDGSACVMSSGIADRFAFDGAGDLAERIGRLAPSEALAAGRIKKGLPDRVEVTTKHKLNGANRPDVIARTQEYIGYRPGAAAFALIDFDRKGMPAAVAARIEGLGGLWPALLTVIPALEDAARVIRQSTSAGLYRIDTGERLPGSGGEHVYIAVKDGTDIERFLQTLHIRCWLAGLGWLMLGAAGQFLERSICDRVVGTPERLIFEGAPVLIPPLAQDAASRLPIAIVGGLLDTVAACPPLDIDEETRFGELLDKERAALAPTAAKVRETFVTERAEELVAGGMDATRARATIEQQCAGILLSGVVLPFDDEEFAGCTVADVLTDPKRFDGATMADPIEGVAYGRCKAKVLLRRDGMPLINSFAHGGIVYQLQIDDEGELSGEALTQQRRGQVDSGKRELAALVARFNAQYAVVNEAGIAVVYEQTTDRQLDRKVLVRIGFEALKKFYLNDPIKIALPAPGGKPPKEVTKTSAEWWLAHKSRRQYLGGVIFDPSGVGQRGCWNLWSGFAVEPKPGDWSLMQDHVHKVICSSDDDHRDYVLGWAALMFQRPSRQGDVALVVRGGKGVGKGIFFQYLRKAWGQHGVYISNAKHLTGTFNSHLRDCVMLYADEAFFAGDRQHEGVQKALITEPILPIEAKYQNLVTVPNMLHIAMTSNSDWVVPVTHDERRYAMLNASDHRTGQREYFSAIVAQMENGGLAAMIWDMLRRNISGFEVRDVPDNAALADQRRHSMDSLQRWWLAVLDRGFLYRSRHGTPWFSEWHEFYTTELLMRSYLQWSADATVRSQIPGATRRVYEKALCFISPHGDRPSCSRSRDRRSCSRNRQHRYREPT
jgi:hypothetical protein